jgi:hypothetical protein
MGQQDSQILQRTNSKAILSKSPMNVNKNEPMMTPSKKLALKKSHSVTGNADGSSESNQMIQATPKNT